MPARSSAGWPCTEEEIRGSAHTQLAFPQHSDLRGGAPLAASWCAPPKGRRAAACSNSAHLLCTYSLTLRCSWRTAKDARAIHPFLVLSLLSFSRVCCFFGPPIPYGLVFLLPSRSTGTFLRTRSHEDHLTPAAAPLPVQAFPRSFSAIAVPVAFAR